MKRRAWTGEEGDVRSGGHRQVRRVLYDEEGADLSGGRLPQRAPVWRALYGKENAIQ